MAEDVLYHVAGRVARVTINRPERRNALTWATIRHLRQAVRRAGDDPSVRVVVLAGAGDRAFCAGADLGSLATGGTGAPDVLAAHEERGELTGLFSDLWSLGKPTVARVRGYALAGGFALAVACDLVVAADDAVFGLPEVDIGMWPFVATVPLVRALSPKKALELMLTGRRVGAEEAERLGLVTRAVAPDALDAAVEELTAVLATRPPGIMKLGRDSFHAVCDLSAGQALDQLGPLLTLATMTDEVREGAAAFAEKRRPRWPDG